MQNFANKLGSALLQDLKGRSLSIWDAPWGYAATEIGSKMDGKFGAEIFLKFCGVLMLVAMGWTWIFAPFFLPIEFENKSALSTSFALVGFGLFRYANRGFHSELGVDPRRREIRFYTCNSRGRSFLREILPMRDVESIFLKRVAKPQPRVQLMFRVRNRLLPLASLSGAEHEIASLRDRIASDLKNARACKMAQQIRFERTPNLLNAGLSS